MADPTPTKRCPACDQWLPLDSFNRNRAMRDGLQIHCNPCRKEINDRYKARKPEKAREQGRKNMRARREADPDAVRAYQQKWLAENAERNREKRKAWAAANRERINAKAKVTSKRYKVANPGKVRADDHKRRALKFGGKVTAADLDLLWRRQCGICAMCGERIDSSLLWPDPMSRSVDHIVPLARGGSHSQGNLRWVHLVENLRKGARL